MENRFGIKDFFLYLLIGGLILTVVMAMWQFDRQFEEVRQIKKHVNDQTNDLNSIKRQLSRGVVASPMAGGTGNTPSTGPSSVASASNDGKADFGDLYFKYMIDAEAK